MMRLAIGGCGAATVVAEAEPVAGRFGGGAAVLVERLRLAGAPAALVSRRDAADHDCAERRVRRAKARQQTPGVGLRAPRQRQQHVLRSEIRELSSRISSYARSNAALASGESTGATSVRPPRSA